MKITIICSITFYNEVKDLRDRLVEKGHEVITPYSIERILDGKITIEEVNEKKQQYGEERNQEKHELITNYMNKVREAGAVLVANYDKNGIANYIGGNTLMEMAFALA